MSLLHALVRLRSDSRDPSRLESFLRQARPLLLRAARTFPDPDEVAQVASIRVAKAWRSCQADSERSLVAWLTRIAHNCGFNLCARTEQPLPAAEPEPSPHDVATNAGRGRAWEEAVEEALGIEPAELPSRHRVAARALRVAATRDGIQRDVAILIALRDDEVPAKEIAATFDLSEAAVRQAAVRGAAAVTLGGRIRAEATQDPWTREGLEEITAGLVRARRGGFERK